MRAKNKQILVLSFLLLSLSTSTSFSQTPISQDFSFKKKRDIKQELTLGMSIEEVRNQTPGGLTPTYAKRIDNTLVEVFQVVQVYGRKLGPLAPPSWTQKTNNLYLYFIDQKLRYYAQPGDWESIAEALVRSPEKLSEPSSVPSPGGK